MWYVAARLQAAISHNNIIVKIHHLENIKSYFKCLVKLVRYVLETMKGQNCIDALPIPSH